MLFPTLEDLSVPPNHQQKQPAREREERTELPEGAGLLQVVRVVTTEALQYPVIKRSSNMV